MINLSETFTYEGSLLKGGRRVTAQKKIKTGDTVVLTFLGASEEEITENIYNPVWETYDDISSIGENYYFEVVVNDKRTYYGKYADSRYTEKSVATGGSVLRSDHTCIEEKQVKKAFAEFKEWLQRGANKNSYWHGLYTKKEFPETISYCMPGEVIEPVAVKDNGLADGEKLFIDIFNYSVLSAKEATAAITGYSGTLPDILEIPECIHWNSCKLTVTEIGASAFKKCDNIKEIIIPSTITAIGEDAFRSCSGVQKFTSMAIKPPVLGDPAEDCIANPFTWIDRCDCPLFVPEKSVDKYRSNKKVTKGWTHFFNILPIGGEIPNLQNNQLPVFDKTWKKVSFIDGKPKPKLEGIQNIWVEEGTEEFPKEAFNCLEELHSIYIPASVKRLDKALFRLCDNLEHVYFEDPAKLQIESLEEMFYCCSHLRDVSFLKNLNTSGVKNTAGMFFGCLMLKDLSPLAEWKTSALENAAEMFSNCGLITDISPLSNWDMSGVRVATEMFCNTNIADVSALSSWDTHSFENLNFIFRGCKKLIDISGLANWNTSNVTTMKGAFYKCPLLKKFTALESWNTCNVKDISRMFSAEAEGTAPEFPVLANWNTSKIETMNSLFEGRKDLKNLNFLAGADLRTVSSISSMFYGCTSLVDISALHTWDVRNVNSMYQMFYGCTSLVDISALHTWDVRNVNSMYQMFCGCTSLTNISALSTWNIEQVDDLSKMFCGCSSLQDLDGLSKWNVCNCKNANKMFSDCKAITELTALKNWKWEKLESLYYLFSDCINLKDISALSSWDVSRMINLPGLFRGCKQLSDISALSSWNVSNIFGVSNMFEGCENLEDLTPLKDWDTCLMMDFSSMFADCKSLTDVSPIAHWNMKRQEKHFDNFFKGCSKLTDVKCLDWRYGSAYIGGMFKDCGDSSYRMEQSYKEPKQQTTIEAPQIVKSFEFCEDADGTLKFRAGDISFAMIPVEGGTYTMGYKSENPNFRYEYINKAREDTVGNFYIGQTQVTQALWAAVTGSNPSQITGPKLPVEWVSYDDSMRFIERLNEITGLHFNLPTQAEWEFAARGGKFNHGYEFAGSNDIDEVAWHCGNANWTTHPVGLKKPNELGLYDMTGNIREMCLDKDDYYKNRNINRGGSFIDSKTNWCRIYYYDYGSQRNCVGLRLVLHKDE